MSATRPLRVAVVGCGDVSVVHLDAVTSSPVARLVAVGDTDPGRARAASERHGVPAFADHRDLLEQVRPDVVHISTPHDQHAQVAVDCLVAGVHVVLEKPLAHTLAEGTRIVEAARANPRTKIAVCFQNRYNAPVRAARDLIASGDVGDVLGSSALVAWHRTPAYYAARPWRGTWSASGGGVLMNQAIHTLDLVRWLVGDVVGVRGLASRMGLQGGAPHGVPMDVEDTAQLVLDHAGGARSVFFATVTGPTDAPVSLEIVTERAVLQLRGDLVVTHADGRVDAVPEQEPGAVGRSYWGASHRLLIEDFHRRVDDPEPFWIGPADGLESLRIIQEVYTQGDGNFRQPVAAATARMGD